MRWGLCAILVSACGGGGNSDADAGAPDASGPDASAERMTLQETGLYLEDGETLAPGVVEYQPAYELYADGADKRRFVFLPEGEPIDTSEMNFWSYPVGTKLWKEFSSGGVRVETRLLEKRGEGDWFYMAYAWNQDQSEAAAAPGGEEDALGTEHDVPSQDDCEKCHQRQPDFVLGFSAIQLDHDLGGLDLEDLIDGDLLSDPPGGEAPRFPIPGDDLARPALGYLHANCGGCHHERSDVMDKTPLSLRLDIGSMATVEETPIYESAVGVAPEVTDEATSLIEPGDPGASAVHLRMNTRDEMEMMPPLATELVDEEGLGAVGAWISAL